MSLKVEHKDFTSSGLGSLSVLNESVGAKSSPHCFCTLCQEIDTLGKILIEEIGLTKNRSTPALAEIYDATCIVWLSGTFHLKSNAAAMP